MKTKAASPKADKNIYPSRISDDECHEHIAIAAYFIAETRGFMPGHEVDDWLTAERQYRNCASPTHESSLTDYAISNSSR